MNNKVILGAIAVLAVLLIIILIVVSIGLDTPNGEPIDILNHGLFGSSESSESSEENTEEPTNSSESESESESSKPSGGIDLGDEEENQPSGNNSENSSSSVINISGNGNSSGSTPSIPSSGNNSGSTSSNPSSGSSSDSSSGFDSESEPSSLLTYEEYIALSGEEQMKYMYSFPSIEAYFEWYNAAKAKYDEEHPSIEIGGDGSIDLGEIIGGGSSNP